MLILVEINGVPCSRRGHVKATHLCRMAVSALAGGGGQGGHATDAAAVPGATGLRGVGAGVGGKGRLVDARLAALGAVWRRLRREQVSEAVRQARRRAAAAAATAWAGAGRRAAAATGAG